MTREWRQYRSLVALLALIALAATVTVSSCSGGGGGSSGGLCAQCGDSDGPCVDPFTMTADDTRPRPSGCPPLGQECTFSLVCLRKLDTAQRRCFPTDQDGQIDILYRCDGGRPGSTTTPRPTSTPGPTSTSAGNTTQTVSLDVDVDSVLSVFSVIVTYPNAKGSFTPPGGGSPQCSSDDDVLPTSAIDATNSLQLSFGPAGQLDSETFNLECTFYLSGSAELDDADLNAGGTPTGISVDVSVF